MTKVWLAERNSYEGDAFAVAAFTTMAKAEAYVDAYMGFRGRWSVQEITTGSGEILFATGITDADGNWNPRGMYRDRDHAEMVARDNDEYRDGWNIISLDLDPKEPNR